MLVVFLTNDTHAPNDLTGQIFFIAVMFLNTLLAPKVIKRCDTKIQEILNPMINSSYSKVSIYIIHALKLNEYVMITMNIYHLFAIVYNQIDKECEASTLRSILWTMYAIEGMMCQLVLFI